jgi:hypothetical protein
MPFFYILYNCNLPLKYYGYTTENVPVSISKILVIMFLNVIFSAARIEGNTTFLILLLSSYSHIWELGQNKAACPWLYTGVYVLKYFLGLYLSDKLQAVQSLYIFGFAVFYTSMQFLSVMLPLLSILYPTQIIDIY